MKLTSIKTNEIYNEKTIHGNTLFPIQYYYDDISKYDNGHIPLHWHEEFEISTIIEGTVTCLIGDQKVVLEKNESIFINSKVLHSYETFNNAKMHNIVFSYSLLFQQNSLLYDKYILDLLDSKFIYLKIDSSSSINQTLYSIYNNFILKEENWELQIFLNIAKFWSFIYKNKNLLTESPNSKIASLSHARLKRMIQFITTNYKSKRTLEDIAKSANISKSEALRCFAFHTKTTPIDYLNNYRINISIKLISDTTDSISDISSSLGFSSPSYFNKVFKKTTGYTPGSLRNKL